MTVTVKIFRTFPHPEDEADLVGELVRDWCAFQGASDDVWASIGLGFMLDELAASKEHGWTGEASLQSAAHPSSPFLLVYAANVSLEI
jgi:hypothetical protein